MSDDIRRLRRELNNGTERPVEFKAVLGRADGTVKATDETVYVTLYNGDVIEVFNERVPLKAYRKVKIGYDDNYPNLLQVLSFDDVYDSHPLPHLPNHKDSHTWYGHDPAEIYPQNIIPLMPRALGGMVVRVYGGEYIVNGVACVLQTTDYDLTAEIPASGAEWVSAFIDENKSVTYLHGTNKDSRELLLPSDMEITSGSLKLLFAAKMYVGLDDFIQTRTDTDIFDPRFSGYSSAGDIFGTGIAGRVAEFAGDSKTLQAAKITGPAVNILTITNTAAATLGINVTAGKTLTLTAADDYNVTFPATGAVALLGTANVFTVRQMIDGTADEIQLRIQGHSTQTSMIQTIEISDGTVIGEFGYLAGRAVFGFGGGAYDFSGAGRDVHFIAPNVGVTFQSTGADSNSLLQLINDAQGYQIYLKGGGAGATDQFIIRDITSAADRIVMTISGYFGIGANLAPTARFQITGQNDVIQARILANSSQTAANFTVETSAGVEFFTIGPTGNVTIKPTAASSGLFVIRNTAGANVVRVDTTNNYVRFCEDGATYKVLVGTASSPAYVASGTLQSVIEFDILRYSDSPASAPNIVFVRGRGSITVPTAVGNGDDIGKFISSAYHGSGVTNSANFSFTVDAAYAGTAVPQAIIFRTGTTSSPTERLRISSAGIITAAASVNVTGIADVQQLLITGFTTQEVATPMAQITRNDTAAGISAMLGLTALGSGANGDGGSILLKGKTSTTAAQAMGLIDWRFVNATHAAYTTALRFYAQDAAGARLGLEIEASGSAAKIGFFGHATAVQPAAYTPSNVSADRSYDANSTTLDEVADVLGTLIADLQSIGLVG